MSSERRLSAAIQALRALPPRAALGAETRRLWRAEIAASTRLAGAELSPDDVDALLDRGLARGEHRFADYVLVRAYAEANRWVALQPRREAGDPAPLVTVEAIRRLNALARGAAGGGAWRTANLPARAGIVAPAAWLVPREVEAFADRAGRGPGETPLALWLARVLARLARIAPFAEANGRTARLVANLILRRLDLPPLAFEPSGAARYHAALALAETNAPAALGALIGDTLVRGIDRLRAAAEGGDDLAPLRALAGDSYAALAKAAQRGGLRTLRRGGRYYTRPAWIADYTRRARIRQMAGGRAG
jgi:Fic family protein